MNELLKKINEVFQGKKSYLLATAMIVLATLQAYNIFTIPAWAWLALGGLGLGFMRAAITKVVEALKSIPNDIDKKG